MKQINYSGSSKLISRIVHLLNRKAPLPLDGDGDPAWGSNGQVLTSDGSGSTYWSAGGGGDGDTVSWTQTQATGTKIAEIDINGTSQNVYTPAVPTKTSDLTNDSGFVDGTDLATALSDYTPTSGLADVALSNDYDDLDNKPSIPTVNDGTLTIQQNGTTVGTFSANQSGNTTVNLTGGGSGGHTIENTSGTDLPQEDNLQFVGVYTDDDSTNDRTRVNIVRSMTKAQMEALSSAEQEGFIETSDEPDDPYMSMDATDIKRGASNVDADLTALESGKVNRSGDTMSGYLSLEVNTDTPLRIKRLSGNSSSKPYIQFSNVSGVLGYYAVGSDKRPYFEPDGGSDIRIALHGENLSVFNNDLLLYPAVYEGYVNASDSFNIYFGNGSGINTAGVYLIISFNITTATAKVALISYNNSFGVIWTSDNAFISAIVTSGTVTGVHLTTSWYSRIYTKRII